MWTGVSGPTTFVSSPSESELVTTCFVTWSAISAATAIAISATHCDGVAEVSRDIGTIPLPVERQNQPDSLVKPLADASDIADFLHKQPGWFRIGFEENSMPSNFGDFYSIEQFGGYLASMPVNVNRILGDERTPRWASDNTNSAVACRACGPGATSASRSRS